MKQQLKNGFICLLACIAIVMTSCKKEKDDPNITYFSYNKTVTNNTTTPSSTIDSVDINKDGIADLFFATTKENADTQYVVFEGRDLAIATNDAVQIESIYFVKIFNKNQTPPLYDNSTNNYKLYEYLSAKVGSQTFGAGGKGDVYLAFGIKPSDSSDDIYYGWIRVNIPADYSSIKFIDGAISNIANTTIPCGSK